MRQSNEIGFKIAELKKQKSYLTDDDETDEIVDATENIIDIIGDAPEIITEFDNAVFEGIIEKIMARSQEEITFILKNGLRLNEKIAKIKR
jgi:hypothetical protein